MKIRIALVAGVIGMLSALLINPGLHSLAQSGNIALNVPVLVNDYYLGAYTSVSNQIPRGIIGLDGSNVVRIDPGAGGARFGGALTVDGASTFTGGQTFTGAGTFNGGITSTTGTFSGAITGSSYAVLAVPTIAFVTTDFLTAVNTNFQPITGLSWTLPATAVVNMPFGCTVTFSQGTATAAVSFGLSATAAPTNLQSAGTMVVTTAGTSSYGQAVITTATSSATVTATPNVVATLYIAQVNGFVENPAQANTIALNVKTATGADGVTIKRGSYCRAF